MSQDNENVNESELKSFAVFRNGVRVSDSVYPDAFYAQKELDYWKGIAQKWKDGSTVEVRPLLKQKNQE